MQSNQETLATVVRDLRYRLERIVARKASADAQPADADRIIIDPESQAWSALSAVVDGFGLSTFERDILLLCLAMELDPEIEALCGRANGDPRRAFPTFGLALAMLSEAHWSALAPDAPLRRWRLIEVGTGPSLMASSLRIDERIMLFLLGIESLDRRLLDLVGPLESGHPAMDSISGAARKIAAILEQGDTARPVIQLHGINPDAMRAVALAVGSAFGMKIYTLPATNIPAGIDDQLGIALLWERETMLGGGILVIEAGDESQEARAAATSLIERMRSSVLLTIGREPLLIAQRGSSAIEIATSPAEGRLLWREALASIAVDPETMVPTLTSQFNLTHEHIRSAVDEVAGMVDADPTVDPAAELWSACRRQSRGRLDDLAQRIDPRAGWEDLVLPDAQKQMLRQIVAQVRRRTKVQEEWGFGGRSARGLGTTVLFAGASGTGKTLSAEVIAGELKLDLYQIDLSNVVSKYIGETEKNLRRIFDAADESGAILLFDEADALFGKRSEVKDSHDRYANLEVSYLLQRIEAYRGLAILTTNMKQALDQAFLRRIRFILSFEYPDAAQRAEIWWRTIPPGTPTDGLNFSKLSSLNVAGGAIWNITLQAAYLAADADEPIRMHHLLQATRIEYAKMEKSLTDAEVQGWI